MGACTARHCQRLLPVQPRHQVCQFRSLGARARKMQSGNCHGNMRPRVAGCTGSVAIPQIEEMLVFRPGRHVWGSVAGASAGNRYLAGSRGANRQILTIILRILNLDGAPRPIGDILALCPRIYCIIVWAKASTRRCRGIEHTAARRCRTKLAVARPSRRFDAAARPCRNRKRRFSGKFSAVPH